MKTSRKRQTNIADTDAKTVNKILANKTLKLTERIIHHYQNFKTFYVILEDTYLTMFW